MYTGTTGGFGLISVLYNVQHKSCQLFSLAIMLLEYIIYLFAVISKNAIQEITLTRKA